MRLNVNVQEALSNLFSAKLRSFLAVLGVLVGTASVVALITGGQLATDHALEQLNKLGTDIVSVILQQKKGQPKPDALTSDKVKSVLSLAKNMDEIVEVAPFTNTFESSSYQDVSLPGSVVAATHEFKDIVGLKMMQGRFLSMLDTDESYCVIGYTVYEKLKKEGLFEVIGKQIKIGERYFTVMGVLEKSPENLIVFVNMNTSFIVPLLSVKSISPKAQINNIVFRIKKGTNIDLLKERLNKEVGKIFPSQRLFVRSPQQLIDSVKSQSSTFTMLLGFIGSIALVVGGIGVMNIMLVSVVERRKEIGVRLAIGARRIDIQAMFLTEAVVLTLFGGLLGVILGETVAWTIAAISGWAFHLYLMPPLIGFVVSSLVGMFFGFYPARQASRLDPIETLRSE